MDITHQEIVVLIPYRIAGFTIGGTGGLVASRKGQFVWAAVAAAEIRGQIARPSEGCIIAASELLDSDNLGILGSQTGRGKV